MIDNIIPKILEEMNSDDENESEKFLDYYQGCNSAEKSAMNEMCIYLCGWSLETIFEKCGIKVNENGGLEFPK